MLDYKDLYEFVRKEKYSEQLQPLQKKFIQDFSAYLSSKKGELSKEHDFFSEEYLREKKEVENSMVLFKELMLRRKKKILNLVFVASETGIMKQDFGNMLDFEKETFEELIAAISKGDKKMASSINGKDLEAIDKNKMIVMNEQVEEFVDMEGNSVGPFTKGELVNVHSEIADILVASQKASVVEEN